MGHNSIKSKLTRDDTISEIKLFLGADIKREHTFIIVEGEDDIKFWKNIVSEKVTICESFSGKNGIEQIIEEYFISNKNVIGVRDRDYEINHNNGKIFYYDYCCMEMMLVKNDDAFNSIYNEYYSGEFVKNVLKETLLQELKYLSLIRKQNEVNKLGIKIDGVSISNAFDDINKKIDNSKIIEKLNKMNKDYYKVNKDKHLLIEVESKKIFSIEDLLLMTQGHDFISLFAAVCRKDDVASASDRNIAASLRCAYRKQDFEHTNLYSLLSGYENVNNLKIVI